MSKELFNENLEKAHKFIETKKNLVRQGSMRQKYHFMAPAGWINDPNGLIYFRGRYHLFYQHNPYDSFWGEMYWGHAVSDDLVNWEYLPIALAPSEHYDSHKEGGCFSGSAIEHAGKLYLIYTGTTNYGDGFIQTQCVAVSEDGVHFEKYSGNPVMSAPEGYDPANFRDPKVWEHEGIFYMVLGAKKDNLAQALLYKSADLLKWEYVNILAESRGELGYMWECPDFYPIGDKYVLMFSPMGLHERTVVYLVGDMNYETGKFTYTITGEIDWGMDFYAPQSFTDYKGRRLLIGWANAWDWMPWWKDFGPAYKEGWCGWYALPREIKSCADHTLQFVPVEELKSLRGGERSLVDICIDDRDYEIPLENGVSYELMAEIDLKKTTAKHFAFKLRSDEDKETVVSFDLHNQCMSFDRNKSDGWSSGVSRSPLLLKDKEIMSIHIYADQSSIEVFTDDYKTAHSCNVFAREAQNKNYICSENGKVHLKKLQSWVMKPAVFKD